MIAASVTDWLKTGAGVTTPLGLLGLIASAALIAYLRKLTNELNKLKALPDKERARAVDSSLLKYGMTVTGLTAAQKYDLILREQRTRFLRGLLLMLLCAATFVICFGLAITQRGAQKPENRTTISASDLRAMETNSELHKLATNFALLVALEIGGNDKMPTYILEARVHNSNPPRNWLPNPRSVLGTVHAVRTTMQESYPTGFVLGYPKYFEELMRDIGRREEILTRITDTNAPPLTTEERGSLSKEYGEMILRLRRFLDVYGDYMQSQGYVWLGDGWRNRNLRK